MPACRACVARVKHLIDLYKLQLQAKAYRDHAINYWHFDQLNLDSCTIVAFARYRWRKNGGKGRFDRQALQREVLRSLGPSQGSVLSGLSKRSRERLVHDGGDAQPDHHHDARI